MHQLSDRELKIALFNLVGALAERLTGEIRVVKVYDPNGQFVALKPATQNVRWGPAVGDRVLAEPLVGPN